MPEWSTLLSQTKVDLKPEAKDVGSIYMRRKLKLRWKIPTLRKPAVSFEANLALFIPSIVLLSGGSRMCPQRGGVQIIGEGFVVQSGKLTEAKHRMHFDKHLEADYIDGSFYVVLEQIQLHANPISCRGCPTNGRKSIIDMRSFQIDLDGSWAKEKIKKNRKRRTTRGRPAKRKPPESPDTVLKKATVKILPPGKRERGFWSRKRHRNEENKKR